MMLFKDWLNSNTEKLAGVENYIIENKEKHTSLIHCLQECKIKYIHPYDLYLSIHCNKPKIDIQFPNTTQCEGCINAYLDTMNTIEFILNFSKYPK